VLAVHEKAVLELHDDVCNGVSGVVPKFMIEFMSEGKDRSEEWVSS